MRGAKYFVVAVTAILFSLSATRSANADIWALQWDGTRMLAVRIAADGSVAAAASSVSFPLGAHSTPDEGAWLYDGSDTSLVRVDRSGAEVLRLPGYDLRGYHYSFDVSARDGSVYIVRNRREFLRLDGRTGQPLFGPVVLPTAALATGTLTVDFMTENVWITDAAGKRVFLLDGTGTMLASIDHGFSFPIFAAVDSYDGSLWLSDLLTGEGALWKLGPDGGVIVGPIPGMGATVPRAVVDPRTGAVWHSGRKGRLAESWIMKRDAMGNPISPVFASGATVQGIDLDVPDGSIWVVELSAINAPRVTSLVHRDEAGTELARFTGYGGRAGLLTSISSPPLVPVFTRAQLTRLSEELDAIEDPANGPKRKRGWLHSLQVKLDGAIDALDRGRIKAALNKLEAFVHEAGALVRAGKLTQAQGEALILGAQRVMESIDVDDADAVASTQESPAPHRNEEAREGSRRGDGAPCPR